MLKEIDSYLNLTERKKLIYQFGRLKGYYRCIDDLKDDYTYNELSNFLAGLQITDRDVAKKYIDQLINGML